MVEGRFAKTRDDNKDGNAYPNDLFSWNDPTRIAADIISSQPTTILRDGLLPANLTVVYIWWNREHYIIWENNGPQPQWIQVIKKENKWHVRQYDGLGIMDYVTDLGDQLSPNTLSTQENNGDTAWTTTKNIHNSPSCYISQSQWVYTGLFSFVSRFLSVVQHYGTCAVGG